MKEKDFQTRFSQFIAYNLDKSTAFELKITHKNSIPFRCLPEHQARNLLSAKHGQLCYKPPDLGLQNPLDMMCIKGGDAYVVVMFYKRGVKHFYYIDIDVWLHEDKTSKRRSLTEERAIEIASDIKKLI
jgi:hypothetical protein